MAGCCRLDFQLAWLLCVCEVMFDEFPKHFVTHLPLLCVIGELSMNNFHRLKEVLVEIKRIDLKNRVEEFEKKLAATRRIPLNATVKQSM